MPQLEAVKYGFLLVVGAVAFGLMLLARARRRERHERNELRAHVRRLTCTGLLMGRTHNQERAAARRIRFA